MRRRPPNAVIDGVGLAREARRARRLRRAAGAAVTGGRSFGGGLAAADSLERHLGGRLPDTLDLCPYLTRIATFMQMSDATISTLLTNIAPLRVPSSQARVLAVALNEFMCFLLGCARPDRSMDLCLAVAVDDDRLVVGLAAMRELEPVPARAAMAALLRGTRLVECVGGLVSRGVQPERIVIGMTFDAAAMMGAIASKGPHGLTDDA